MIEMEPEPDEWQIQIASSMRDLGFEKINYQLNEKTDVGECCIYYTNFKSELYSTESYVFWSIITILFHEKRGGQKLRARIKEIMQTVEREFVESEVAEGTTFIFGQMKITGLGTSYRAEIPCSFREEVDHG